jgi:hypothetical protein
MRDRILIYGGLAIFLGLAAFPVWHDVYAGVTAKGPNPVLPTIEKQCVAPVEYMKSSHGNLLMTWREDVVRGNKHSFAAFNGKSYTMNLTSTCLAQCHAKKSDFCDRCHNYAAVSVPCWDCHLDSGPVLRSAR